MTRAEVEILLASVLRREAVPYDIPSTSDWQSLERKFSCNFPLEFRWFIELMAEYVFPGDILNVSTGRTNGNPPIQGIYDFEMNSLSWPPDLIPFYSIGNGDYFCLKASECPGSAVYYLYHEDAHYEFYCRGFEEWIRDLPDFLS